MQSNLIVEARRAAEGFDRARQNDNEAEAERAGRAFLDHMMSLESPFPEEANTLSDPEVSANATDPSLDIDGEKARLMRKKEEVEKYLQGLKGEHPSSLDKG